MTPKPELDVDLEKWSKVNFRMFGGVFFTFAMGGGPREQRLQALTAGEHQRRRLLVCPLEHYRPFPLRLPLPSCSVCSKPMKEVADLVVVERSMLEAS